MALGLSGVIWLVTALDNWWKGRKTSSGRAAVVNALKATIRTGVINVVSIVLLLLIVWSAFVIYTLYANHMEFVRDLTATRAQVGQLQNDLEFHRHNLVTTDPVFSNIAYMLQAFASFRGRTRTTDGQPDCQIKITAPLKRGSSRWASGNCQAVLRTALPMVLSTLRWTPTRRTEPWQEWSRRRSCPICRATM